jgi:hypothetical protein
MRDELREGRTLFRFEVLDCTAKTLFRCGSVRESTDTLIAKCETPRFRAEDPGLFIDAAVVLLLLGNGVSKGLRSGAFHAETPLLMRRPLASNKVKPAHGSG